MYDNPLLLVGEKAGKAASFLQGVSRKRKDEALLNMAASIRENAEEILHQNALDVEEARRMGKNKAFLDRLMLTAERIEQMACGLEKVASLPDPVGEVIAEFNRPNGIRIKQVRVPIGVIGFIYESRGTVTCDAAALCLKSGNAVILRGGKEASRTNKCLAGMIRKSLSAVNMPEDIVQLLSTGDREEVKWLCRLEGMVDVIIPRGGKGLVSTVMRYAKMPVLKHLDGICHTYVDCEADLKMALMICDDAKTQRPGVCNTMETLLVDEGIAAEFLPQLADLMKIRGVELRGCGKSLLFLGENSVHATDEDWVTEYEDLILAVKIVSSLDEAIDHINKYGSHHSDAIVTKNDDSALRFQTYVDSACVYHNCSTRFSDGEEFGFGAEIGIGTDKLHARGPMALRELTSYKYVIDGTGQVKDPDRMIRG